MKRQTRAILIWFGLTTAFIVPLAILVTYNVKNNPDFFKASCTTYISIIIAVCVSFLLTQRQTDKRKRKDILLSLLTSLQVLVSSCDAYIICEDTTRESINMRKRDISNRLRVLDQYKSDFGIEQEVSFLNEKFREYEEFIGNHIDQIDYLKRSSADLKRPLELIDGKIFEIMLKLYK